MTTMQTTEDAAIKPVDISDELKGNFITYAEEVIRDRALPCVRDGLKPVHRRILWTMYDMGARSTAPTKKSARVVGNVMGYYHPHGDMAIYDAAVRMAQQHSISVPLIDGQGNFGSTDFEAANQRYTEMRLSKFGEFVLFSDINDDTVDFVDNYTGEFKEPVVLPARIPLVLLTASSGIAVGMATTFLPHNLEEVCNALIAVVSNPKAGVEDITKVLPAPDFPLGGLVKVDDSINETYKTGRGSIKFRAAANFESEGKEKAIIIENIPYAADKSVIIKTIAELVRDDKLEGVSEIRDESSDGKIRICIELKSSAGHEAVLNSIYSMTNLETSFSMNNVAIVDRKPKTVGIMDILHSFVAFRREVIRRRSKCQKAKAEAKLELANGVLIAVRNYETVAKIAHDSKSPVEELGKKLKMTETQADYVLGMPIRRLAAQDEKKLETEIKETEQVIKELASILSSQSKVDNIIKAETEEIKQKFATPRKTVLVQDFSSISAKEMVKQQEVVLAFMSDNTVKSTPVSEYRLQRRRTRGVTGLRVPDGIHPNFITTVNSHDDVMLITDKGNRYILHAYDLPAQERERRPRKLADYVPMFKEDEQVVSVTKAVLTSDESLAILSEQGMLKKQGSATVMGARSTTTMFYPVDKGGKVVNAVVAKNDCEIIITTAKGQILRTNLSDIREVGSRSGFGVRAIRVEEGDKVLSVSVVEPSGYLLTVSKKGYVKRTKMEEFAAKGRGGKGVRGCNMTDDELVFAACVPQVDEEAGLFLMTNTAQAVRIRLSEVGVHGRTARGSLSQRLEDKEFIKTVSVE